MFRAYLVTILKTLIKDLNGQYLIFTYRMTLWATDIETIVLISTTHVVVHVFMTKVHEIKPESNLKTMSYCLFLWDTYSRHVYLIWRRKFEVKRFNIACQFNNSGFDFTLTTHYQLHHSTVQCNNITNLEQYKLACTDL